MEPPCTAVSAIVTNKQMSTDAKHTVNDPRDTPSMQTDLKGGTDFPCVVSGGGQSCMGGHLCMEPHVSLSSLSKPNEQEATHAKHMIKNTRGMPLPIQMHVKGGSDFQCVVPHGGQLCMEGQWMEPPCMAVHSIETQ